MVVAGLRWWPTSAHHEANSPVYLATQERRSVDLDDGSNLLLNRDSEIAVRFAPDQRLVDLRHGEAHFKVAHDTTRPFVVAAGGLHIQAVGTAFNVRYMADQLIEVLVTEGTVRVTRTDADAEPLLLTHDQFARIALRRPSVARGRSTRPLRPPRQAGLASAVVVVRTHAARRRPV
ncbi:MAG: FecR domain-containing protein [Candidatus Synoicihabitans palmerolidicus]|nr:FecR domain-containing protein [Candidatus Synoicihabitans palmerolidicus]